MSNRRAMTETPQTYGVPLGGTNDTRPEYVIGIDPGSHEMGVAVFRNGALLETFTIKAPAKVKDADERAFGLLSELGEWRDPVVKLPLFIRRCVLVFEDPVYMVVKGHARPIVELYRFIGHLDQWAREMDWTIYKYPVPEIKLGIAGRVSASKAEVEAILRYEFDLHEAVKSDHEWDAISVGWYHLQMERIKEAMNTNGPV